MSVPYAIVDRNGMVAAIVPGSIVAEVMTSALVPNMGYRMECRPATEEEIYELIYQLEQNRTPVQEDSLYVVVPTLPGRVGQGYGAPEVHQVAWPSQS